MQNFNWRLRTNDLSSALNSPSQAPSAVVSPTPPAAPVALASSAAAAARSTVVQSGRTDKEKAVTPSTKMGGASGVDEVQRRVERALWQGRGGWRAATAEKQQINDDEGLRSPLNPSSPPFSPRSKHNGTTPSTRSSQPVQFGAVGTHDPVFYMPDIGVWKASPAHPSPRQAQPLTSSLSSLRLSHHALQAQLSSASNELLLLQADSQEHAWLSSRLTTAEERNAELQRENDELRREMGRLGRHKEGVDELLGVSSPPGSPFAGRGMRATGLVRGASNESTETEADPRSTTPRPPSSTARPPAASDVQPPAPHLSPSADARSLILHDLLDELRSANSTIRDLHNSLAEKEATIQNLGAELVMAREEKVKLLVQLFEARSA